MEIVIEKLLHVSKDIVPKVIPYLLINFCSNFVVVVCSKLMFSPSRYQMKQSSA